MAPEAANGLHFLIAVVGDVQETDKLSENQRNTDLLQSDSVKSQQMSKNLNDVKGLLDESASHQSSTIANLEDQLFVPAVAKETKAINHLLLIAIISIMDLQNSNALKCEDYIA